MKTCANLLRDSRAALRGTRFLAYLQVCLVTPFRAPCSRIARYDFYQVSSDCHVI